MLFRMMVPEAPTANPSVALTLKTSFKLAVGVLVSREKVLPLSVEVKILPEPPTTQPVLVLTKWMALKPVVVLTCEVQVVPLLIDFKIVPLSPTAKPVDIPTKKTDLKV